MALLTAGFGSIMSEYIVNNLCFSVDFLDVVYGKGKCCTGPDLVEDKVGTGPASTNWGPGPD